MLQSVILQVEKVTRRFAAHTAVNDITLKLHQGEILGLLGPSGCGKTTLLRLIAGFERPQTGTIALDGRVVAGGDNWLPPERRDVGMVFQDYALFPHLTLANNVAFGLRNQRRFRKYTPKQVNQRVEEAIALVGLTSLENRYPHELSGGQQQRVALARALAPQPSLVLLDEPLSNLDVQVRLRLRQEIRDILKQTGTSAVFVTHDQEEALSLCDRVAVIHHGQIEQWDTPEAIYQQPASRFVAEFVTQANFLPAQWNGVEWETEVGRFGGGVGEVREMGEVGRTRGRGEGASSEQMQTVELMIRQEDLMVKPDGAGTVVVRDRQFLGRDHRYCLVSASGRELYARTDVENLLPIGSRVSLSAPNSALRVFETYHQA